VTILVSGVELPSPDVRQQEIDTRIRPP